MDNPEKFSTLDTQDTGRRHTKQKTQHRKLKKIIEMNKTDHKNPGVKPGVHQGQGVPASYMTPAMLLI
jgi:hypothetical protein